MIAVICPDAASWCKAAMPPASVNDRGCRLVGTINVAVHHRNGRTVASEPGRDGAPESPGGARDECDAAGQVKARI